MMIARAELLALARQEAEARDLDPAVLGALIEQESGWDPWAVRYEPRFYERYVSPLVANANLSATEARLRAFSFGLCQVMGQTAREAGYAEALTRLLDPAVNVRVGVTVLLAKLARVGGDLRLGLLAYNGGGRPAYADEVLARMGRYA